MKTIIIFFALMLFSNTAAYSKAIAGCKDLKKFSIKAAMCKTKAAGSSIKNKLSKKRQVKKESDKRSIFKKFQEAKMLTDLK